MSNLQYWLALNFLDDIGPVLTRKLIAAFGSPEIVFHVPVNELIDIEGIGRSRARKILEFNQWDRIQKEIDRAEKNDIRILAQDDKAYPEGLKHIYDSPLVLYVKGSLHETDKYAVAMVGSRSSSQYGRTIAEEMASKLALSGLTIVSGMARGIDTAAHKGALGAGGRTIAVLGSGLDRPYPAENSGLMRRTAASGAVISEFPFGTGPLKENFPRRNRIISALSLGVVVVEATLDSGSLITVTYALEQGREVFAVPGNITSRTSRGTNGLIKKGAKLVDSIEDIIHELRPQIKSAMIADKRTAEHQKAALTHDEKSLFGQLSNEPKHIDTLLRESSLTSGKALSILLNLELKGIVRQFEGKYFSLI